MVQTIQASVIPLDELALRFGLQEVKDDQFFREWQDNLPEITDLEKQMLVKGETPQYALSDEFVLRFPRE